MGLLENRGWRELSVDLESLHRILKHPIRRRIVLELHRRSELTYTELMGILGLTNTGKLNYHLKMLGDLIEKDENGRYCLTEKGRLASQLLIRFPEKRSEAKPLTGGDAVLIGSAGFLTTLINPGIWLLWLLGAGVAALGLVYALLVPAFLMWLLTVRRTGSHNPYDLYKPPLFSLALLIGMMITFALLDLRLPLIFVSAQDPKHIQQIQPVFLSFVSMGLLPFLGILMLETIRKIRHESFTTLKHR